MEVKQADIGTVSRAAFDLRQNDQNRIRLASQNGVDRFEWLAREYLPAILGVTLSLDQSNGEGRY